MSNYYGNIQQDGNDFRQELEDQNYQIQGGNDDNGINLHPSISKSIVNEQENTGFCKNTNTEG